MLAATAAFFQTTGMLRVTTQTSDDIAMTTGPGGDVQITNTTLTTGPLLAGDVQSIVVLGGQGENVIDLSGVLGVDFTQSPSIFVDASDGGDTIVASELGGFYFGGNGDNRIFRRYSRFESSHGYWMVCPASRTRSIAPQRTFTRPFSSRNYQ